ncbi:TSUP family transporter [Acidovorax temperans]|uniref:TSUP family transporter n=1 Tax=Acidovorax temperans TaxID=80878 RepID=UPI0035B0C1DE
MIDLSAQVLPNLSLAVLVLVPVLATVQSLFGVGLLLFGTPILLLLGMEYANVLLCLLPASITISCLQIREYRVSAIDFRDLLVWILPSVIFGAILSLKLLGKIDLRLPIAFVLLLSAALQLSQRFQAIVQNFLSRIGHLSWLLTGVVHGMSNMGGGLLTAYAASRHNRKLDIHREITSAYAVLATGQLFVLYLVVDFPDLNASLLYPPCAAAAIYFLFGKTLYRGTSERAYKLLFPIFMLSCSALLLYQVMY